MSTLLPHWIHNHMTWLARISAHSSRHTLGYTTVWKMFKTQRMEVTLISPESTAVKQVIRSCATHYNHRSQHYWWSANFAILLPRNARLERSVVLQTSWIIHQESKESQRHCVVQHLTASWQQLDTKMVRARGQRGGRTAGQWTSKAHRIKQHLETLNTGQKGGRFHGNQNEFQRNNFSAFWS